MILVPIALRILKSSHFTAFNQSSDTVTPISLTVGVCDVGRLITVPRVVKSLVASGVKIAFLLYLEVLLSQR